MIDSGICSKNQLTYEFLTLMHTCLCHRLICLLLDSSDRYGHETRYDALEAYFTKLRGVAVNDCRIINELSIDRNPSNAPKK